MEVEAQNFIYWTVPQQLQTVTLPTGLARKFITSTAV